MNKTLQLSFEEVNREFVEGKLHKFSFHDDAMEAMSNCNCNCNCNCDSGGGGGDGLIDKIIDWLTKK